MFYGMGFGVDFWFSYLGVGLCGCFGLCALGRSVEGVRFRHLYRQSCCLFSSSKLYCLLVTLTVSKQASVRSFSWSRIIIYTNERIEGYILPFTVRNFLSPKSFPREHVFH